MRKSICIMLCICFLLFGYVTACCGSELCSEEMLNSNLYYITNNINENIIDKSPLVVKAKDTHILLGNEIPKLSAEIIGVTDGDIIIPSFTIVNEEGIVISIDDIDTSIVAQYTIKVSSNADIEKYDVTYEDATLQIRQASRPSSSGVVIKPATGGSGGGGRPGISTGGSIVVAPVSNFVFTSDIYETNKTLFMDFSVPAATNGKYMLINAYNNQNVVGRKLFQLNFSDKLILMGCNNKPDKLKINVWDNLSTIKPISDYTEFKGTEENEIQTFNPVNGFPSKYPEPEKENVSFITAVGSYSFMGKEEYEIELLNSDGSVVIYGFADSISVKENGIDKEILNGLLIDGTEKVEKSIVAEYIEKLVKAEKTTENFAKRIITFKTNSANNITSISFSTQGKNIGLSYVTKNSPQEYNKATKKLGEYGISNSTVIFYTPFNGDRWDYKVVELNELTADCGYSVAYLNIDEQNNAKIVVITEQTKLLYDNPVALVVGSVVATNEEGEKVVKVTFLQNGEEKTLTVDAEAEVNDNTYFPRGAAFEYSVNAEGNIDDAKFCGFDKSTPITWTEVKALASTISTKKTTATDFTYIGGYVIAKNGSTLTLANTFDAGSGDHVTIPSSANVYMIDVTKSKVIPQLAAIGDIDKCKYYTENGVNYAEEYANTFVLIKYVDKEIIDVIAYYGFDL